jgi:photosystem II stability/assembly factor-like uncharacterized protein
MGEGNGSGQHLGRRATAARRLLAGGCAAMIAVAGAGLLIADSPAGAAPTWTPQTSGVSSQLGAVSFVNATDGWAVGETGKIVATTNGGTTWATQTLPTTFDSVPATFDSVDFTAVSFVNATDGWAVGRTTGLILATTDGGATWTAQTSGTTASLYGVSFANSTDGWAVGTGGGEGEQASSWLPPTAGPAGATRQRT